MTDSVLTTREDRKMVWRNEKGQLHRTDGPAIVRANGDKEWFVNGTCHRTDGPAVENSDGSKEWRINGVLHRTDGPALIYPNGSKQCWENGRLISNKEISDK